MDRREPIRHEPARREPHGAVRAEPKRPKPIGCVIAILVLGLLVWLDPSWFRPLRRYFEVRVALDAIESYPSVMSIDPTPGGAVFLTTKYDVSRFDGGDPKKQSVLLDPQIFRSTFGRKMDALASAAVADDGSLWVGSWYGEILSYDGSWRQVVPKEVGPSGKVSGLVLGRDARTMWIAADGLWWAEEATSALERMPEIGRVEGLAALDDEARSIAAFTDRDLWVGGRGGFRRVWSSDSEVGITALESTEAGGFLVGTRDGFVELDSEGDEVARELRGQWVTGFADAEGSRLVATWEEGLLVVPADDGWRKLGTKQGLGEDSVYDLLLHRGRLWIGTYGGGAFVTDLETVERLAAPIEPLG